MRKEIQEFRVVDHGTEHAQYFQGHGVAFTAYTDTFLGNGISAQEAAREAAEQMAMSGFEIPPGLESILSSMSTECIPYCGEDSELYHYVSIDVRA